jgi:hypothetical protein
MYKKYTESLTREVEVGANVPGGTPLLIDGRAAVTLAASGGSVVTKSTNLPGNITSVSYGNGGVGYRENCAVVAFDGSWLFPVATAVNGETVPDSAAGTNEGTTVYITGAGALTLASSGNTAFGKIDDGNIVGGVAPVKIGAGA